MREPPLRKDSGRTDLSLMSKHNVLPRAKKHHAYACEQSHRLGAARVGFDWENLEQVLAKLEEEIAELRAEMASGSGPARMRHEIGDLLLVNNKNTHKTNNKPKTTHHKTKNRNERRFRRIEERLAEQGRTPAQATLAEMEALWMLAKREEGHAAGEAHPPRA